MVILIASGQGGAGKTSLTAALARAFANLGKKTVAIDGCCRARDLDMKLGAQDKIVYDWADVLDGDCSPAEALVQISTGLHLLASPQMRAWQDGDEKHFRKLLQKLKERTDIILIDCPAYTLPECAWFSSEADTILMLSGTDDSSLRKAGAALDVMNRDCDRCLAAIQTSEGGYTPEIAAQVLDIPLIGTLDGNYQACAERVARSLSGITAPEKGGFLHLFRGRRNRV